MGLFTRKRTVYGEGYDGSPISPKDILRAKKMFKTKGPVTVEQIEAARKPLSGLPLVVSLFTSRGRARAKAEHSALIKSYQDEAKKHINDGGSYGW